jgi:hypothetical protein
MSDQVKQLEKESEQQVIQTVLPKGSELVSSPFPAGAKVVIPAEKVSPAVKKERTEAQKEAYKRMRAALDESTKKRQFSRKEALGKLDELKEQERLEEEEKAKALANELKEKTGAEVVVQKTRGRKPGQHIPYKKYDPSNNPNINTQRVGIHPDSLSDAPSPPLAAVYQKQYDERFALLEAHTKALQAERDNAKVMEKSIPLVAPTTPLAPVYQNPYFEMIRRKKR